MSGRRGFTLMELAMTALIIGVLAAFGVPQYIRTVEVGKADSAVSLVNMIGTTNKMFALDHAGYYVTGQFTAACGAGTCPASVTATQTDPCVLVWCKYLADQDWGNNPYTFYACDGATAGTCGGLGSGNQVAAAQRLNTVSSPYNTWGYGMDTTGRITGYGTDVSPPTY